MSLNGSCLRCRLQRDEIVDGSVVSKTKVEWVPEHLAVVGTELLARCPPGLWLNGWEVMEVLALAQPVEAKPIEPPAAVESSSKWSMSRVADLPSQGARVVA